jgi:hypothetical protein
LHGEFASISEFSDEIFTNYLILKREQLDCGQKIIKYWLKDALPTNLTEIKNT